MPLTNLLQFTRCEESWRVPRTSFETIPVLGNSRRKCNANSPASIPAPACPLPSWLRLYESVGVPADVNIRISHLAECQSAALEHAPAAAAAAISIVFLLYRDQASYILFSALSRGQRSA